MALFGRESENHPQPNATSSPRPTAPSKGRRTTLIAAGATLVGEITGDTDVMIEGTVEGKVHPAQNVTVGADGVVRGEIKALNVRVAGRVQGNVRGKESVEILSTGSLEGDVSSPGMVIGDGAFFKGRVEMTGHVEKAQAEKPQSPPPLKPLKPASTSMGDAPSTSSAS